MAAIIKNQILKHLSKFTKNLSYDKINISTLKGEGELSNLELNEHVLMDLLDLPTWMKLNKAICNKVSIKVQWTKLKSQPICLYLDEVVLEIETCAEPRSPNDTSQQSSYKTEGRYGFVDKVIDGIYVHINSVAVNFMSEKFLASLQLSRVKVQSLNPIWGQPTDIRQTRIRSEQTDEILLFKEVDWQTTRIEANAREEESSLPSTPLRLIANQSKIRIVLKKRISDCSLISSRITFLLDDLLWVLTDTQLKAAILYANSLSTIIDKSAEQSKLLAAEKLQKQGSGNRKTSADVLLLQEQQQSRLGGTQSTEAKMFQKFDALSTSYHLITGRIDLHLCDDTPPDQEASSKHNSKINGGSMQMTFCKLSVDFYPFHYAGGERKNWYRYTDNLGSRNSWTQELFTAFRAEARKARETCHVLSPTQSPAHTASPASKTTSQPQSGSSKGSHNKQQPPSRPKSTKLLESCFVLKIEDFTIYMVSTADSNKRGAPQKLFSSDKKALHLPADMSTLHLEYTNYFFTEGIDYPVPSANMYVLLNPVCINVDFLTMLWMNYFFCNLSQTFAGESTAPQQKMEHLDIKVEALMPRIIVNAEEKVENQPDRPNSIQVQISKVTASNTHVEEHFQHSDLKEILEQYINRDILRSKEFPNDTTKVASIPKIFHDFSRSRVNPYLCGYAHDLVKGRVPEGICDSNLGNDAIQLLLRTDTLKRDMRCDMWCVALDQVWLEFNGVPTSRTRPVPFVESFPLTLWMCQSKKIPNDVVLPSNSTSSESVVEGPANQNLEREKQKRQERKSKKLLKQYYSEETDTSDASSPVDSSSETSNNCDNLDDTNVQYGSGNVADVNIVGRIGTKLRLQFSNPQYMFLMRLAESLTNFQEALNADVDDFFARVKGAVKSEPVTFSFPIIIPSLEVALVSPYIAELLPLSNPPELSTSPKSEGSEYKEGYVDGVGAVPEIQPYVTGESAILNQCYESNDNHPIAVHSDSTVHQQMVICESFPDTHIPHSQSDSTIVCHSQTLDPLTSQQSNLPGRQDSHSTEDVSQNSEHSNLESMNQNPQYTASDSGLSSIGSQHITLHTRSRSGSKLTPTTVKKSFTSGVTNFSNFVGKIKNKLDPDDLDDFDSMSMKTDISDDDDFEYLTLDDNEMPAFIHSHQSETASSTDTDDLSSVFAESTSATRAKEYVSAVVFRLSGTELLIQGVSEDIFLCLQTQSIDTEETGNIIYEDFYNKLSSQHGVIRTPANVVPDTCPIKFKMTLGPAAEEIAPNGAKLGLMDVRVKDYEMTFRMSSILNLASLVEDEKIPIPTPMHVTVNNFMLTLLEDRPPPRPLVTTCSPPPVNLNIHTMFIYRYDDGVFHMSAEMPTYKGRIASDESPLLTKSDLQLLNGAAETTKLLATSAIESDFDMTGVPPDCQDAIMRIRNENAQLKSLLERLDNHTQLQENEIEQFRDAMKQFDKVKSENHELRSKLKSFALIDDNSLGDSVDLRKVNSALEKDNNVLMERVLALEEETSTMKIEKDSLVSTLQFMQDELIASEQVRQRKNTGSSE